MTADNVMGANGVRLWAPLVACVPVDIGDYPEAERTIWIETLGKLEVEEPAVPADSIQIACAECQRRAWLGPKSQAVLEVAAEFGLRAIVVCMLCAPFTARDLDVAREAGLFHTYPRDLPRPSLPGAWRSTDVTPPA